MPDNYTVTITDQSATRSQELLYNYEDVHPGYTSTDTISFINQSSSWARIEYLHINKEAHTENDLFHFARLSLTSPDGFQIRSPSGTEAIEFTDPVICLAPDTSVDLTHSFRLPTRTDNTAQATTLGVTHTIQITTAPTCIDEYESPPIPPDTSTSATLAPPATGTPPTALTTTFGIATNTSLTLLLIITVTLTTLIFYRKILRRRPPTKASASTLHKVTQATKAISSSFLALCFITLASIIALTIHAKSTNQPITILGHQPYILASGSMEPEYQTNSLVVVRRDPIESVKTGDLVAFASPAVNNQTALHRVTNTTTQDGLLHLEVKGDANPYPDSQTVTAQNYLGRASWHTNLPATVATLHSRPYGWLATIVLPLLALTLIVLGVYLLNSRKNHPTTPDTTPQVVDPHPL